MTRGTITPAEGGTTSTTTGGDLTVTVLDDFTRTVVGSWGTPTRGMPDWVQTLLTLGDGFPGSAATFTANVTSGVGEFVFVLPCQSSGVLSVTSSGTATMQLDLVDAVSAFHLSLTVESGESGLTSDQGQSWGHSCEVFIEGFGVRVIITRGADNRVGHPTVAPFEEVQFVIVGTGVVHDYIGGLSAGPVPISIDWDSVRGTFIFTHTFAGSYETSVLVSPPTTPAVPLLDITVSGNDRINPGGSSISATMITFIDDVTLITANPIVVVVGTDTGGGGALRGRMN